MTLGEYTQNQDNYGLTHVNSKTRDKFIASEVNCQSVNNTLHLKSSTMKASSISQVVPAFDLEELHFKY